MAHETRPRTLDPEQLDPLEVWLARAVGADCVSIIEPQLLSGGAVGENWRLAVEVTGGPRAGRHDWVLRTDAHSRMAMSHDRAHEFLVLQAAYGAGVMVPEPVARCEDTAVIGAPFMVAGYARGNAQARKIVRGRNIAAFGPALAEEMGRQLARLHSVHPPQPGLEFLDVPEGRPAVAQVAEMRGHLDTIGEPRPALEYVLGWLEAHAPERKQLVLCHGDFRTGNYMVDGERLTGILDWEFAHWGDRHQDVGWFCARSWRFGADDKPAGGIAGYDAFFHGYNAQSDVPLSLDLMPYWEIMGAARWAIVALLQGERHHSGNEPSLELVLTGMMAPEMELDALCEIASLEEAATEAAAG